VGSFPPSSCSKEEGVGSCPPSCSSQKQQGVNSWRHGYLETNLDQEELESELPVREAAVEEEGLEEGGQQILILIKFSFSFLLKLLVSFPNFREFVHCHLTNEFCTKFPEPFLLL